jgi:serine/threonine-protein kinase HipA
VIFNFLIGNHDAHGKNFSLLYGGEQIRLAPLYDLLSTSYYPELSPKMAMKIGGKYLSTKITAKHFEQLAEEAGLAKLMVKRHVPELAELILSKMPALTTDHPVVQAVAKLIQGNCDRTIKKFKV